MKNYKGYRISDKFHKQIKNQPKMEQTKNVNWRLILIPEYSKTN